MLMMVHCKAVRCRLLHGIFHCRSDACCRQVVLLLLVVVLVTATVSRHVMSRRTHQPRPRPSWVKKLQRVVLVWTM